jgi:hypothetical protein
MGPVSKGLAPLSPAGPGQGVDFLQADVLEHLPHDAMALVVGPCMDMITAGQTNGESAYVLGRLRSMLRRVVRGLYECEMRRAGLMGQRVDFDPSTR